MSNTDLANTDPANTDGATLDVGGVTIAYDDHGTGGQPMLLVHGMACDRHTMAGQLDHFGRTRRTVAYDQRGHGDSDKPLDADYGPAALADDAVAVIDALGLERPVVVGHSLGGSVALALAAGHPDKLGALVLLDATLGFDDAGREGMAGFYDALDDTNFDRVLRGFVAERLVDGGDDPVAAARVTDVMTSCPVPVFVAMGRGLLDFDVPAAVAAVTVPTLYVASSRPWVDLADVHRARPDWYLGRTVAAGHFHNLLVADQVNAMIDAFCARVDAGYPAAEPSEF